MSKSIVRYDTLQIQMSEYTQPFVTVPRWETPVLIAVHGDNVVPKGSFTVERELPEAGDEFTRLAARYGPKNSETPYVAGVYGNFGPGVNTLAREIENSVTSRRQIAIEARERADETAAVAKAEAKQREAEELEAREAATESSLNEVDAKALQNLTTDGLEPLAPPSGGPLTEADVQALVS